MFDIYNLIASLVYGLKYINFNLRYQQGLMSAGVYVFVVLAGIVGIVWSIYNYIKLKEIDLGGEAQNEDLKQALNSKHPGVVEIGMIIKEGAS